MSHSGLNLFLFVRDFGERGYLKIKNRQTHVSTWTNLYLASDWKCGCCSISPVFLLPLIMNSLDISLPTYKIPDYGLHVCDSFISKPGPDFLETDHLRGDSKITLNVPSSVLDQG